MTAIPPTPLRLGHRGARNYAPENTFAAFDLALAQGCDGFEFDVRLTADGCAVVCHDPMLNGLMVAAATYRELAAASPHPLPQLSEVMERYAGATFLNIELKVPGLESEVILLMRLHPPRNSILVSSFLPVVLETIYTRDTTIPLGFICRDRNIMSQWRALPITHAVFHHSLVTELVAQEIAAAEKKLFVWTLNDREEIARFAAMGIDGIISDDTLMLCRALRGKAA